MLRGINSYLSIFQSSLKFMAFLRVDSVLVLYCQSSVEEEAGMLEGVEFQIIRKSKVLNTNNPLQLLYFLCMCFFL